MDYVKLEAWRKLDAKLKALKEEEMKARLELFKEEFKDIKEEGTHNLVLDGGWKLVANLPYTRKLDKVLIVKAVDGLRKFNPHLIKTEYSLSVTEYKKLDQGHPIKAVVDALLTTTPGCVSMKLVAPK